MKQILDLNILIAFLFFSIFSCKSDNNYQLDDLLLGIAFPPLETEEQVSYTIDRLKELNSLRIRFATNWKNREPTQGDFNWTSLTERIRMARENNISLFLTIQSDAADWACSDLPEENNEYSCVFKSEDDFRNYVSLLLDKYAEELDYIQFGNEWNSTYQYVGTAEDYVRFNNILYEEVMKRSPRPKFVLGSISIGAIHSLAGCLGLVSSYYDYAGTVYGPDEIETKCSSQDYTDNLARINTVYNNASYEIVDIHFYDDVENWPAYFNMVKDLVPDYPIIFSEFGGPNANAEDYEDIDLYQAERIPQYITTLDDFDILGAYYFSLLEHPNAAHPKSGLIDTDLNLKPAYEVFKQFGNSVE